MKRGTPDHPKTLRLAAVLKVPRFAAVGLLEMLWHWTARYAPQGDIGRFSDEDIALALGWTEHKPEVLVGALAACGWLDAHKTHRYLIHDWNEHAEEAVKKYLDRNKLPFLTVSRRVAQKSRQVVPAVAVAVASAVAVAGAIALPLPEPEESSAAPPVRVFDRWRQVMGHPDAKFTAKRERRVKQRLAEGYTVTQLYAAIEGCKASPFHQGQNQDGKVYDDLELICRDGEHVERFLRESAPKPKPQLTDDSDVRAFLGRGE